MSDTILNACCLLLQRSWWYLIQHIIDSVPLLWCLVLVDLFTYSFPIVNTNGLLQGLHLPGRRRKYTTH